MPPNIILTGPLKAGKRTTAPLLAERLGLLHYSSDRFGQKEFEALGYEEATGQRIWDQEGPAAFYRYAQIYHSQGLLKILEGAGDAVVELKPDFTYYVEETYLEKAHAALSAYPNVVRLLPSPDLDASVQILNARVKSTMSPWEEVNDFFVEHSSNYELAKITAYTKDKTPAETTEEIIGQLNKEAGEVILIGPINAGKTTIGNLLSARLGLPQQSLDLLRWDYHREIGYDEEKANKIRETEGAWGIYRYWSPFNVYSVERVLAEKHNCIIDFGGGHSVYDELALLERAKQALAPFPNVVLLLPSADKTESKRILRERSARSNAEWYALNELFIRHPSGPHLAKITVYTEGQTPAETLAEVLRRVSP